MILTTQSVSHRSSFVTILITISWTVTAIRIGASSNRNHWWRHYNNHKDHYPPHHGNNVTGEGYSSFTLSSGLISTSFSISGLKQEHLNYFIRERPQKSWSKNVSQDHLNNSQTLYITWASWGRTAHCRIMGQTNLVVALTNLKPQQWYYMVLLLLLWIKLFCHMLLKRSKVQAWAIILKRCFLVLISKLSHVLL